MEVLPVPIQVLEEEDERDEWSPPGSGRKLWDPTVRGEERGARQGRKVISCGLADWKPLWCACVVYQLSKNDKCNSKIFSYVVNM